MREQGMPMLADLQLPGIEQFATWIASWLEPLSRTGLGFVKWEAQSRATGGYIAILLVLALLVGRALMGRSRKKAVFFYALSLVLVLLLVNVALAISNDHLGDQRQILFWRDTVWHWAYSLFCASIPCFVVTTTYLVGLRYGSPPPTA